MDTFEDELELIREELYEQTKDMGKEEAVAFVNNEARKIAAEYGFRVVKGDEISPKPVCAAP